MDRRTERYSDQNVANALLSVGLTSVEPDIKIVESKLKNGTNTHSIIHKKYPLYELSPLPSHMYFIIDGKTFHPGALTEIFSTKDASTGVITLIEEKCDYCTYNFLLQAFNRDRNFNIFINNCQMIMGNYIVTPLLWLGIILMWIFCINPSPMFLFLGSFIIIFATTYDKLNDLKKVVEYKTCPHIISL